MSGHAVCFAFMAEQITEFENVSAMLRAWRPEQPVYCIYPEIYRETARAFVQGFPGRVLYAVKANDDPAILRLLHESGVSHFDCASVPEIERVRAQCPGATCYFMVPVALRGAAHAAQRQFAVRHFMVDHVSRLEELGAEIDMPAAVVFARMAVSHESALVDLSSKFGAPPEEIPVLLRGIREQGAEPALAFNVGTMVTSPEAYRHAIGVAQTILQSLDFRVRLVDIGGGFAKPYPDFPAPRSGEYFQAVEEAARSLPLQPGGEIMAEPGRALAAPGLSAVVEVLLRKDDRLYINDGMYGIFWELRFEAHKRYAARTFRDGEPLCGAMKFFTLYGPTCDSSDKLPGKVPLPEDIRAGDYIEFSHIGAYSLGGRTDFNGHFSDRIVYIRTESV